MRRILSTLLLLPFAFAIPASAQTCKSGVLQDLVTATGRSFSGVVAMQAGATIPPMSIVARAADRSPLRNVRVELSFVSGAASADFGTIAGGGFVASPTPDRVVVSTGFDCVARTPAWRSPAASGAFDIVAREVSTGGFIGSLGARIVAPTSPLALAPVGSTSPLVPKGASLTASVSLRDALNTPVAGSPVQFTLLGTTGATFADGTRSVTAVTDGAGVADAPLVAGAAPGSFDVVATTSDGARVTALSAAVQLSPIMVTWAAKPLEALRLGPNAAIATLSVPGIPCANAANLPSQVLPQVLVDGAPIALASAFLRGCPAGMPEFLVNPQQTRLAFGAHVLSVSGGAGLAVDGNAVQAVTVVPDLDFTANGTRVQMGVTNTTIFSDAACTVRGATTVGPADVPALPASVETPLGILSIPMAFCRFASFDNPLLPVLAMDMVLDRDPPPNAQVWGYGTKYPDTAARWQPVDARIEGRRISFITGPTDFLNRNPLDSRDDWAPTFALVVDHAAAPQVAGLWWGGARESGWGLTLSQSGDALFGALFLYDDAGSPRWLVMSSGSWNAAKTQWTGDVRRPRGAPASAYRADAFVPGPSVGTVTLDFGAAQARLDAVIDGRKVTKSISRFSFAAPTPFFNAGAANTLSWGGASQNGWGVVLQRQEDRAFLVWYTYDEKGETTWFFASDMVFPDSGARPATLYQAQGSAWPTYDASKYAAIPIAPMSFAFGNLTTQGAFPTLTITRFPF